MMKKRIAIVAVISLLGIIFYWISAYGFVEVRLVEAKENTGVSLLRESGDKPIETTIRNNVFKKLLRRGSYQIAVSQGDGSYFSIVNSRGFLRTNVVQTNIQSEKNRWFVGNNPLPCMEYIGQVLASFGCGDAYKNAQLHMPATPERATYTINAKSAVEGLIEGMVTTREGTIAVLHRPAGTDSELGAAHAAYIVNPDLTLRGGTALPDLDLSKTYTIKRYKNGFIAHDTTFTKFLYYTSFTAKPTVINMAAPKNNKLKPYIANISGESIIVAYTDSPDGASVDVHEGEKVKAASEVIINTGPQAQHFAFNKVFSSMLLCGTSKLCQLNGKLLEVYNIDGSKPQLLFTVSGVESIKSLPGGVLAVRNKELLALNVDTKEGSFVYTYGDYAGCGLHETATSYTLCVINGKGKKVALRLDQQQPNTDSIDKKIAALIRLPELRDVSIYDKVVFVSPILGEPTLDPATNRYTRDVAYIKKVGAAINQEIDRLGIDRRTYRIINPFDKL